MILVHAGFLMPILVRFFIPRLSSLESGRTLREKGGTIFARIGRANIDLIWTNMGMFRMERIGHVTSIGRVFAASIWAKY